MAKANAAARIHAIAEELGCAPELVAAVRAELKLRKFDDVRHAVIERLSRESAKGETTDPDQPREKKEKKAGLTLSQRRALLRLLDEGSIAPASAFKALPYEHLVGCGYAVAAETEGDDALQAYTLTDEGRERAESINPGYRVWAQGESVVEGGTLNAEGERRPPAGTKRVVETGHLV
jgi:hypothetical protein